MSKLIDYAEQLVFVLYVGLFLAFGYGIGLSLILRDRPFSALLAVIFFSPVMMLVWRIVELLRSDDRSKIFARAIRIFNPSKQSWAFMFGDTMMLSYALLALTRGWREVPVESWFHSPLWAVISLWIGAALSGVFILVDGPRYKNAGVGEARLSPTKVWHDYAVFPVVLALILFAGVPQLRYWSFDTSVAVVAILLFIGLCIADGVRDKRGTLDPGDQHLCWDPIEFRTLCV